MSTSIMQTRQECYICRAKYNVSTVRGLRNTMCSTGRCGRWPSVMGSKSGFAIDTTTSRATAPTLTTTAAFGSKKRHRPLLRPDMDTSAGWLKPERII